MRISIIRVASRPVVILVLAVGLVLGAAGRAEAGALNPLDFASLGAFPTATGQYTINTSGIPTLTEPNGTTLTGVVFNGIAVFDFDSINVLGSPGPPIPPAQSFIATGSLPLALLSRTDAMIAGVINGSGQGAATGGPPLSRAAPAEATGSSSRALPVAAPAVVAPANWSPALERAAEEAEASEVTAVPESVSPIFLAAWAVPRTATSRDNFKAAAVVAPPPVYLAAAVARSRSEPSVP